MENTMSLIAANKLTMTGLEIAELTGKRHDNVIRDIKAMLDGLGLAHLSFEGGHKDGTVKGYHADVWLAVYSLEII